MAAGDVLLLMSLLIITVVRNSVLVHMDPCLTQGAKPCVFLYYFLRICPHSIIKFLDRILYVI